MRLEDLLTEMPITNWEVDPDLYGNEKTMMSKFTGYSQEQKHWSDSDKRAITHEPTIARVKAQFLHVPYEFNFYFWQSTEVDYDPFSNQGIVDDEWILKHMGEGVLERIKTTRSPTNITIIFTNNMSDEEKINMRSPWMVAHRIAHCFLSANSRSGESWEALESFGGFVENLTKYAYGTPWPSHKDDSYFAHTMREEMIGIYAKILGPFLGTMASARNNRLTSPYEWFHETFTQWLLKGKITLNQLPPEIHPDEVLTTNPKKLAKAQAAWKKFPVLMDSKFDSMLNAAKGETWVM